MFAWMEWGIGTKMPLHVQQHTSKPWWTNELNDEPSNAPSTGTSGVTQWVLEEISA
jgi:hypothetical protein